MKQLWKKLVLCVLTLALCCNLVPMAFAADASYYNVYLEAQGGTCDVMQLYAYKYGSNYRLTSTPTPTMEGYKFDGWYDVLGDRLSKEAVWIDAYGTCREIFAMFVKA